MRRSSFVACAALAALFACSQPVVLDSDVDSDVDSDSDPSSAPDRAVVYQLVVRHFGNLQTSRQRDGTLDVNGCGRFVDINDKALDGLTGLGVTDVWLTGVPRQATLTDWSVVGLPADDPDIVKGRAGSFYAVRDYYDVSPDYAVDPAARRQEFKALVDRVHAHDLRVLIDFVPNHVSRSYRSVVYPERDFGAADDRSVFFAPDNSFFYLVDPPGQALILSRPAAWNPSGVVFDGAYAPEDGSTSERVPRATGNDVTTPSPSANDWYETVKLNYGYNFATAESSYDPVPSTWLEVDRILSYWQELGVDGFRVDFAHLVPLEAWTWILGRARERDAEVWFVAEAYADLDGLLESGFDAVYHDAAYDGAKRIYQGTGGQPDFDAVFLGLRDATRDRYLHYLENHDERRIASAVVTQGGPDDSGFGGAAAAHQLAPILFLATSGPVLLYNGQEVAEDGSGVEGFGGEDGRTSIFDYWSSPALQGWVNDHRYDGAGLSDEQARLRRWYSELFEVVQHRHARALGGYWALEYVNNSTDNPGYPDDLYTFARFDGSGGLLVVVANFRPGQGAEGNVRLPSELLDAAGVGDQVVVRRIFDQRGAVDEAGVELSRAQLSGQGFVAAVGDQAAAVFEIGR